MSNTSKSYHNIKKKVSKRQIAEYDLSKTLISLLWDEPFYARILRSLTKIESEEVPTAGVLCKEGNPTMLWNREFFASLKEKERKGVIKHECLHLVFNHTSTRIKEPHLIWNYATDLSINCTIPKDELPKGGLIPGEYLPELNDEETANMSDEDIQRYHNLSKFIKDLPVEKTADYYFEKLMDNEEIKESLSPDGEGGDQGKNILTELGFDSHEDWGNMSEDEKEMFDQKIKEILKSAAEESDANGWGSVSGAFRKNILKLLSNNVKWESILKRFCGLNRRAERVSTIKRINKKYPGIYSGFKREYKPVIAIYLDESGSVNDNFIAKIFSELEKLSKLTDFYLYRFDTAVHDTEIFWKKGKKIELKREFCGGTNFNAPTKHALKNNKKFDGYIIITDGLAPKPEISRKLKRCWLISEKDNLNFTHDRNDTLIKVNL